MELIVENTDEAISNDMGKLGVSYKFDCKFIVGSGDNAETIYGCRYLFAVESPVFERMLLGDFQEGKNAADAILLPDDDPKAVRFFRLLTCCSERASCMEALSLDDTLSLAQFCHKYMTLTTYKLCTARLLSFCKDVNTSDLIKMFAVTLLFGESRVHDKVVDALTGLKYPLHAVINELNQDAFKAYLQHHILFVTHSTISVFTAIEQYIEDNDLLPNDLLDEVETDENEGDVSKQRGKSEDDDPENFALQTEKGKQTFLRSLVMCIDFSRMDSQTFISGPGFSDILTDKQKYYILSSICNKRSPIKLFAN